MKITLEDRLFTLEEVVFLMSEAVEQPEKNEYDIVDFFFLKKYKKQQEALMAKERAKNYMRLKDGYKEKTTNYTAVEWLIEQIKKDSNLRLRGFDIDGVGKQAKEIEKQQQAYSKEKVDKLLDTLLHYNMCSVAGDELIEKFKNK